MIGRTRMVDAIILFALLSVPANTGESDGFIFRISALTHQTSATPILTVPRFAHFS